MLFTMFSAVFFTAPGGRFAPPGRRDLPWRKPPFGARGGTAPQVRMIPLAERTATMGSDRLGLTKRLLGEGKWGGWEKCRQA